MCRFKPPCAEDENVKLDHEEEEYYCQHCQHYFFKDEMQDIEYEICQWCFEEAVKVYGKWSKIKLALTMIAKDLIDNVDDKFLTIGNIAKLHEYIKGIK